MFPYPVSAAIVAAGLPHFGKILAFIVVGFVLLSPGVILGLGILLYPRGHERRAQLKADLYDVPYRKRLLWVASTLVRCVLEGVPARVRVLRSERKAPKQPAVMDELDLGDGVKFPLPKPRSRSEASVLYFLTRLMSRRGVRVLFRILMLVSEPDLRREWAARRKRSDS